MTGPGHRFLDAANGIGLRLARDAVWSGARCNWLGASMEPLDGTWTVTTRSFGSDLYAGTSGVALFLARLFAFTGERPLRTAAVGAVRHAMSRPAAAGPEHHVALFSGEVGVALALLLVADWLDDPEPAEGPEGARARLKGLRPEDMASHAVDGAIGLAGAVPALLWLAGRTGDERLFEVAVAAGERLLSSANRGPDGWSWHTMDWPTRRDLTGFGHGAAGIGAALVELFAATGDGRFREGALEAFRYERRWFSPERGNWPDFRLMTPEAAEEPPVYGLAWCHGAPGIGLSRLRAHRVLDEPTLREEAEVAIRTTAAALDGGWDTPYANLSLCHGNGGNAELLLEAAPAFGEDLRARAERVGDEGLERFHEPALPWPCGVPGAGDCPGLMLGLAGIGYFYLRLYDPAVPSMLSIAPGRDASAGAPGREAEASGRRAVPGAA